MSTTSNGLNIVYGAGGLSPKFVGELPAGVTFHEFAKEVLEILKKEKIGTLDTAEIYPGSEEEIGYQGAADRFIVDTKLPGAFGPSRQKDEIIAGGKASLERLKTKQVSSSISKS
jgi:aflatoxin B1 aldehyde reductase